MNDVSELNRLREEIDKIAINWHLNESLAMNINLVLEEIITNIIFYAYDDDNEHIIDIELKYENDEVNRVINDDGNAFDPTKAESGGDVEKDVNSRKVGGLGIHFIKSFTDSLKYFRESGRNVLELKKNLK
jgi:serine/threonine-protein kinase RsbW